MIRHTLRSVSHGLTVAMALSVVLAFCPCVPGMEAGADDCCQHPELSISSLCCDRAPAVSSVPASPALVSLGAPLAVRVATFEFRAVVVPAERVVSRAVAARTILRI